MGFLGKVLSTVTGAAGGFLTGGSQGAIQGAVSTIGNQIDAQQNYENALKLQMQGQQWQESIIDKQNQWNSAPEQAKRYREAGINPVMALGNGQSGIVSAGGSSGTNQAPPVASTAMSFQENARINNESDIARSTSALNNASAAKAEAETDTENELRALKVASYAKNNGLIDANTAKAKAEEAIYSQEEKYLKRTLDARVESTLTKMTQEQYRSIQLFADAQIASFNAAHIDERYQQELALLYAQTILAVKSGNYQDAAARAQDAGAFLSNVLANNQNYTPEQREQLLKSTLQMIRNQVALSGADVDWKTFDKIMNAVSGVLGGALSVAGLGFLSKGLKGMPKIKGFGM